MTDKQAVIDALQRLPEGATLEEIREELRIMVSIRRVRADIAAGRTKTHEEAEDELEALAVEGLDSGEPIEIGPGYWEAKHRQLDERLSKTAAR
jgi:hypothetical protein